MAFRRALPSAVPGGEGGGANERVGSLLGSRFGCLFWDAFSDAIFVPSDAILKPLGTYFGSLWAAFLSLSATYVVFWKLSSRAGESSKIKVQGSLKWLKNWVQVALDCGLVLGSHFSEKIYHFGWKNDSQMDPKLQPKLDLWPVRTPNFHPWVDKVAQVVTNGAQSGSRGAQSTPKRHLNGVKVGHKVSKRAQGALAWCKMGTNN